MSTEEKAKAYDEALEKANAHINNKGIGDTVDLCKHLFPELSKSEDERIRKAIVATIEQCPDDFLNPKNRDKMLAYLEKQKEQKPTDFCSVRDDFDLDGNLNQKPAWSEEDEIHVRSIFGDFRQDVVPDEEDQYWLKKKLESICLQPMDEWSEEDIAHRNFILESLEDQIRFCKKDAEGAYYAKQIRTAQNWLKSLRPYWKPSEEHLSALLAVFNDPNNIGSQTCQLALTDLYEQLKKL